MRQLDFYYGDLIFEAVLTILYAGKIAASFYKVQYEHIKQGALCCLHCVRFCQELVKFDDI